MKFLTKLSLTSLMVVSFGAASLTAGATVLSSKAISYRSLTPAETIAAPAEPLDTTALNSKADVKKIGSTAQVKVARTASCTKTMDMASNACQMHCQ